MKGFHHRPAPFKHRHGPRHAKARTFGTEKLPQNIPDLDPITEGTLKS